MKKRALSAVIASATITCVSANGYAADLDEKAILRTAEKVVAEHRVYATCLSLDSIGYQLVQDSWDREVKRAMEALKELGASLMLTTRFAAAVRSEKLIDGGMSLSAAMTFCKKNEARVSKFYELGFSRLADEVQKAAVERAK
jgi:hypothetical protein